MDPAWISALSGLAGAVIGAGAAVGGQLLHDRHDRRVEWERDVRALLAEFWEVADRLWRSRQEWNDLRQMIEMWPAGSVWPGSMSGDELISEADHAGWVIDSEAAEKAAGEADIQTGVLLGRMRLLDLAVTQAAQALREASRTARTKRADHDAALRVFEEAARALVPPPRRS